MCCNDQPKQQTTTQTSTPYGKQYWDYAQKEAKRLYQQPGPEYFPFSTVAPVNQYQQQSMDLASQGAAGKLDPVFENVRSKVMPAIDTAYARSGRRPTGAGGYGAVAADALTNAYAPVAQQQYNTDYNRLYQAGQDYNRYQQSQIQDRVNRWNYYQNLPWDKLSRYQGGIATGGGTTSSTAPYYNNPFLQGLGTFAQLGSLFF